MVEAYGFLLFAGFCVLLVIWLHYQQSRHRQHPSPADRESRAPLEHPVTVSRTGLNLSHTELEELSATFGFKTYRVPDAEMPRFQESKIPHQRELRLHVSGDDMILALHALFSCPCSGQEVKDLLETAGLQLVPNDGIYKKFYDYYGDLVAIYFVAAGIGDGRLLRDGRLVDSIQHLVFFTQLPLPIDNLRVFNGMLRVAEDVCDELDGRLVGEDQEFLTPERKEQLVCQVEDFSSKHADLDAKAIN